MSRVISPFLRSRVTFRRSLVGEFRNYSITWPLADFASSKNPATNHTTNKFKVNKTPIVAVTATSGFGSHTATIKYVLNTDNKCIEDKGAMGGAMGDSEASELRGKMSIL